MNGYVWLAIAIALAAIVTLGGYLVLEERERRKRWARYDSPKGAGTLQPVLCPHCRQRSYSERANRERVCPNCHKSY